MCNDCGPAKADQTRAWISCAVKLPPKDVVVETKIDDAQGVRNIQALKRYRREEGCRDLWFTPDGGMYVYYAPTHWRACA